MSIIDFSKYDTTKLREEFLNSKPFNYIVIDDFLDNDFINNVENELRIMDDGNWYDKKTIFSHINNQEDTIVQSKKVALNIRDQIPEKSNEVINLFFNDELIQFIENITDIRGLQSDYSMMGGGIHRTLNGGHLSIHADFNIHPELNKHRRINALLYLNKSWKPEYGGELELWSKDMKQCEKKVEPINNRLIIFRITDDAYHGHPSIWNAPFPRLSFAFYYYTDDRPENEKAPFHWASWQLRNGEKY
jgi:Rps23 Pro-64 3,4-dihydroxylase Tpa1-like proline 4-hydroxylase